MPSVRRGAHPWFTLYRTIEVWGLGSDDVGLIQSTKAPKHPAQAPNDNKSCWFNRARRIRRRHRVTPSKPRRAEMEVCSSSRPPLPPPCSALTASAGWQLLGISRQVRSPSALFRESAGTASASLQVQGGCCPGHSPVRCTRRTILALSIYPYLGSPLSCLSQAPRLYGFELLTSLGLL
jgi:hypothetical protein